MVDSHGDSAGGACAAGFPFRQIVAYHFPDQVRRRDLSNAVRGDPSTVTQDRYAVCNSADFIHTMADINDSYPLRLQAANVNKKSINLGIGQGRGGFIQDK